MNPVTFIWDSRTRSIHIKWNGFFSIGWVNGKAEKKVFGIPVPALFHLRKMPSPSIRLASLKEGLSFLKKWRLRKIEGTFSFPNPMVNGVLYGWLSAFESIKENRKIDLAINFLEENWCSGEATVSPKVTFHYFKRWVPLFFKRWGRWSRRR
jgi:hypothetical protein